MAAARTGKTRARGASRLRAVGVGGIGCTEGKNARTKGIFFTAATCVDAAGIYAPGTIEIVITLALAIGFGRQSAGLTAVRAAVIDRGAVACLGRLADIDAARHGVVRASDGESKDREE